MNIQLLTIFIVLSVINVILNTIKSIVTVNGGKFSAALINAITFFVYTYVIIYTNCELPMLTKAIITGVINFVGVYIVKLIEEKTRKDRLWKIELTVKNDKTSMLIEDLESNGIPFNYIEVGKNTAFNIYAETQKQSKIESTLARAYNGKTFASESKVLY